MDVKQGILMFLILVGIPLLILVVFEIGVVAVGLLCDLLPWEPIFCK